MAKGKYADIIPSLPKWENDDLDHVSKVKLKKREILDEDPANRRASTIAQLYADVRLEKEAHEALLKEVNLRYEAVCQLLEEAFEVEGTTSMGLVDGPTIRVQYEPHAKVVDRDANRLWAIKSGYERSLMLPWQSLNKLTKDQLILGNEEPDGVVAFAKWKIVMTK